MGVYSSANPELGNAPQVVFEYRPEEDRAATIATGRKVNRDVAYVTVRPANNGPVLEHRAEEWVKSLADLAQRGQFPQVWAEGFAEYYESWKKRREIPAEGFAVRYWAAVDRSTVEDLLNANLVTVEQLAKASDAVLEQVTDGEALRARAKAWLDSADTSGKLAEQCVSQKAEIVNLKARIDELQATIDELKGMLDQATEPKVRAIRK